ncbi:MAG: nodulation protein NfeD [Candidatus Eisenbacteria bacterium]|nr:nodulation protein NfeD [Candidatus Eisenbacteria bacterium]
MRIAKSVSALILLAAGAVWLVAGAPRTDVATAERSEEAARRNVAYLVEVSGVINPASSAFIVQSVEKANQTEAECVIIRLDTPGGLLESTRQIVKAILASEVPVVVYVAPSGSRAASAGVFISLACHVVAMAPGTNIGAAHPVGLGGEQPDTTMTDKIVNDSAAYIKSIARHRGRNEKWAEDAVRKSVSVTETEAVRLNVADLVCGSVTELLDELDGREVKLPSGPRELDTEDADVEELTMNLRFRILNVISDPNIAYILLILGIYGIFFELSNPGSILPGVLGGIFILLSLYALQTLPVNYAGLLLILLAIILFIAEIKITSYGLLTVGGVICMALGSMMLLESPEPYAKISWQIIVAATASTTAFFMFAVAKGMLAQRLKPTTGKRGLVGEVGRVRGRSEIGWKVFVHGELWDAEGPETLEVGDAVRVKGMEGFRLIVEKYTE